MTSKINKVDPTQFFSYLVETANISENEAQHIDASLKRESYKKGDILLRKGELCRHSFFVEKGLLRSYMLADDGKEHVIQFAPEKWFIVDRSSTYFNEASDSFIEAIEDTNVVLINDNFICEISKTNPNFNKFNDKLLHNHIRQMQKRINLLLGASAEVRYLSFIKTYPDLLQRVPQWMIASYLGITPESLSRVRKDLAHKNFKPS